MWWGIAAALAAATAPGQPLAASLQVWALPTDAAPAGLSDGDHVSAWESFVADTTSFPNSAPWYRSSGGPYGMPTLAFRGTGSSSSGQDGQWMVRNASLPFAVRSNGGFTVGAIGEAARPQASPLG